MTGDLVQVTAEELEELRKALGPELIVVNAGYITAMSASEDEDD